MDDRRRHTDRHPGSAPPTPYYRDRYPDHRPPPPLTRGFSRDRYPPLDRGAAFRSSSAGYASRRGDDPEFGGPSSVSKRWPERRMSGERVRAGDVERERYQRHEETARSVYGTSPPADRFGNRPSAVKPVDTSTRHPRMPSVPSPPYHPIQPTPRRNGSEPSSPHHNSRHNEERPERHPSHPRRGAVSDGEDPSPSSTTTRPAGGYRSLLERMEPRASSVGREVPAMGQGVAEPYEKELGEISPELGRSRIQRYPGNEVPVVVGEVPVSTRAGDGGIVRGDQTDGRTLSPVQPSLERAEPGGNTVHAREVTERAPLKQTGEMSARGLVDAEGQEEPATMADKGTEQSSSVLKSPLQRPDQTLSTSTETPPAPESTMPTPGNLVVPPETADTGAQMIADVVAEPIVDGTARERSESMQPDQALANEPSPPSPQNDSSSRPGDVDSTQSGVSPRQSADEREPVLKALIPEAVLGDGTPVDEIRAAGATDALSPARPPEPTKDAMDLSVDSEHAVTAEPSDFDIKEPQEETDSTRTALFPVHGATERRLLSDGGSSELTSLPSYDTIEKAVDSVGPAGESTSLPQEQSSEALPETENEHVETDDGAQPPSSDIKESQEETDSTRTALFPVHGATERRLLSDCGSSELTSLPSFDAIEQLQKAVNSVGPAGESTSLPQEQSSEALLKTALLAENVLQSSLVSAEQAMKLMDKDSATANAVSTDSTLGIDVNDDAECSPQVALPAGNPPAQVNAAALSPNVGLPNPEAAADSSAVDAEPPSVANVPGESAQGDDDPADLLQAAAVPTSEISSPAPTAIQLPKVDLAQPHVTQRMLERQVLLGRYNVMTHSKAKQRDLAAKVHQLKRQYSRLDKEWESHKTRIIAENEELARQLEAVANPATVQEPKPAGRKTRRGFVEQDHELMGFRDGDEEALAKALKAIEEMMESDPTQRALKTEATIPDMELDPDIWRLAYDDENALVRDPLVFYGHGVGEQPGEWTEEEERKFRRLYAAYPKQFGEIAKGLPNKTASQCVKHYYLTKKKRPFKEGANRNGQRQTSGGQAARMVAPVTREKVELAGVLATGDRAQAKQVADNIRPQGDGKRAGKRKADDVEKSGDQGSKDGQKAKRKSGKKRLADSTTAGEQSATPEGGVPKKRKTQVKKPLRLDLKDTRAQSTSNRSSSSRGPSTGPPTAEFPAAKGPQPGVFMPDAGALPHRLIGHPPERTQSTPIVTWQDQQPRRETDSMEGDTPDRTIRASQTVPPEATSERRSGGMAITSLLNNVSAGGAAQVVKPASVASDATEDEGPEP